MNILPPLLKPQPMPMCEFKIIFEYFFNSLKTLCKRLVVQYELPPLIEFRG